MPTENVNVLDPAPLTEIGLNDAVVPVGNPLTFKVTGRMKPLAAATPTDIFGP